MPRWTRDFYCGQCGRSLLKGEEVKVCPCIHGRVVTGLRYCVFCGEPVLTPPYSRHECGSHALRDYWREGIQATLARKPRKLGSPREAAQPLLFGE